MPAALDYLARASSAWLLGFFPFLEIYAAVPAAFALGLDPVSAVVWPVLGNVAPVLLIVFAYERLLRIERLRSWLLGRRSARFERWTRRYGGWFVLLVTPWIGVWAVAATAMALGMPRGPLLAYSVLSIVLYAVLIAVGIVIGFDLGNGA
ncbi:MAG: small multi-drug export protein [Trueperaceae bacterium]